MTNDEASLRAAIEAAYAQTDQAEAQRKEVFERRSAPPVVRSFVTRIVMWVWAIVIVVGIGFIVAGGTNATSERISSLFEIIKIGLIPIVTLVIGHYFGSKSD